MTANFYAAVSQCACFINTRNWAGSRKAVTELMSSASFYDVSSFRASNHRPACSEGACQANTKAQEGIWPRSSGVYSLPWSSLNLITPSEHLMEYMVQVTLIIFFFSLAGVICSLLKLLHLLRLRSQRKGSKLALWKEIMFESLSSGEQVWNGHKGGLDICLEAQAVPRSLFLQSRISKHASANPVTEQWILCPAGVKLYQTTGTAQCGVLAQNATYARHRAKPALEKGHPSEWMSVVQERALNSILH